MTNYFEKNPEALPYLYRLVEEWEMHKKIIIACDFDDTICSWKIETNAGSTIKLLIEARKTGAYIVIFTASHPERYNEIRNYCSEHGLEIDEINKNPIDLPYGKHGKIYANIYIDDRAGLNESLAILENAMYTIRGKQVVDNVLTQIF